MNLSPLGRRLVRGDSPAWADLLRRPVRQVKVTRPRYKGSSSRLRQLEVLFGDEGRLLALAKFTSSYEARVYDELATHLPLDVPRAFYIEQAGADGLCLLEALPPGKSITAWSAKDERLVLGDLARLHAAFWRSPELDNYPWLICLGDDLNAQLDKAARGLAALRQVGGWPGVIAPRTLQVMEILLADQARLLAPLSDLPITLVHCDAWQPNWVLFEDRRVLLDWQSVSRGPAVWDVVYFLEMSGEAGGQLPLNETEALECYLDALDRERGRMSAWERTGFLAAIPAVSVISTLARWPAYALDFLRPVERLPVLAHVWRGLPRSVRQRIEAWAAWTDLDFYRRTFERFEERARQVYGA